MTVMNNEDNRAARLEQKDMKPCQLAHLVLRTAPERVDAMAEFYLNFLNATEAFRTPQMAFLRYDEEHHRIVVLGIPGLGPVAPRASGLEHYAFTYHSMGELLAQYKRLKSQGVSPTWSVNHGFTTSIYYKDPDGNLIETQYDNMTVEEADQFMAGEYFSKNPVGVDFDPDVLLKRYENGDPIEELVKLKSAPYPPGAERTGLEGMPPYDADGDLL